MVFFFRVKVPFKQQSLLTDNKHQVIAPKHLYVKQLYSKCICGILRKCTLQMCLIIIIIIIAN